MKPSKKEGAGGLLCTSYMIQEQAAYTHGSKDSNMHSCITAISCAEGLHEPQFKPVKMSHEQKPRQSDKSLLPQILVQKYNLPILKIELTKNTANLFK